LEKAPWISDMMKAKWDVVQDIRNLELQTILIIAVKIVINVYILHKNNLS